MQPFGPGSQMPTEKARHNALVAVSSAGDVTFIRHLLDQCESGTSYRGGITTLSSPYFGSPIHAAVTSGHEKAFKILRAYGVRNSTSDQQYLSGTVEQYIDWKAWSALGDASASGHYSVVRMLVRSDPEVSDSDISLLLMAVRRGYGDAVDVFLDICRHSSNQVDARGLHAEQQILSHACRYGRDAIVKKMLDRGIDPNFKAHRATLYLAACSGDLPTMKLLRQRGAILGRRGDRQRYQTELSAAAVHGHHSAVDLLLTWGVAIDDEGMKQDAERMVQRGHCMGIRCLVSRGFDPAHLGGHQAMASAAWNGREHIVDILLQVGMGPNPPPSTPPHLNSLYAALESRHYRIARMLLAHGANRIKLPKRFVSSYYGVLHQAGVINRRVRNPCGCNCKFAEHGVSWGMDETTTWHHQRRESDEEVLALALACKEDRDVVRGKGKVPPFRVPAQQMMIDRLEWVSFEDFPLGFMQD